jgi:hypothetical protein
MKFKCKRCGGTTFELMTVEHEGKKGIHLRDFPLDYDFPLEPHFYARIHILTCETCKKIWQNTYMHELEDKMIADGSLLRSKEEEFVCND